MTDKQRSFFDDEHEADLAAKRGESDLGRASRLALGIVRANPGLSGKQLDEIAGWSVHAYLADLERDGFVERCGKWRDAITGRDSDTWRAK